MMSNITNHNWKSSKKKLTKLEAFYNKLDMYKCFRDVTWPKTLPAI